MNDLSQIGDSNSSRASKSRPESQAAGTADVAGSEADLAETPVIDRIPRLAAGRKLKHRKPPRPTLETPRTQILLPQTRTGWLKAAGAVLGAVAIATAGLFGVHLLSETGCREFGLDQTTIEAGGLKINVLPTDLVGSFGVKLSVVSAGEFGASAHNAEAQTASANIPQNLTPVGDYIAVKSCSINPKNITLRMAAPPQIDMQAFGSADLYGWDSQTRAWRWLGGEVDAKTHEIIASTDRIPTGLMLMKEAPVRPTVGVDVLSNPTPQATLPQGATELSVPMFYLGDMGKVTPIAKGGMLASPGASIKVTPVTRNWGANGEVNRTLLRTMLESASAREAHVTELARAVSNAGYDGLEVDYRGVVPEQTQNYVAFVEALARKLAEQNKSLTVVVPAPLLDPAGGPPAMPGYDLRRIGGAVTQLKLDLSANPALMLSDRLGGVIGWTTGQVNGLKLQLVLPTLSVRQDANGRTTLISLEDALAGLAPLGANPSLVRPGSPVQLKWRAGASPAMAKYDVTASSYSYSYIDARGIQQTVWLGTAASTKQVLAQLAHLNVRGVTLRGALSDGNDMGIEQIVDGYLHGKLADAPVPQPKLKVAFGTGTPFTLPLTDADGQMQVQAPGGDGNYTLSTVFESGRQIVISSVPVQISKDAPLPTTTISDTATSGAAAGPAVAGGANIVAASVTPAGVHADGFELGGVVYDLAHVTQMKGAGMTWAKTDVRGFAMPTDFITLAKAKGMKVLVTATGDRTRVMDEGYRTEWTQYLGRLAALGVDAIEVWSEPNYEANWPTGQINGANYAELLKQAYAAIKKANSHTLVISAALVQTSGSYSGGCDAKGCDELAFLGQMAGAGAQDAMDCIGVHYTSGFEPPGANGQNQWSWYFEPLSNGYYGALSGAKPVCFTALGYVTADGFQGGMPALYSFAAGTTVASHAAWLAEAAKMSRASGKVRLMIVWNVDSTVWRRDDARTGTGGDPAAGYAMIRPDGTCPACESLRAAMGSQ